jgi:hypothetical protein
MVQIGVQSGGCAAAGSGRRITMHRQKLTRVLLLLAFALAIFVAAAADGEGHDQGDMDAWIAAMTPAKPHGGLAEQAGEWSYVVTIWEGPGAEPMVLDGVSVKTMIMGGRFLKEELTGEFMDRPFQGFGITGFDNVTGEYVAIWFDNMSTGIHWYTGREDAQGVKTYKSTVNDPSSGKAIEMKSVGRVIDRDHHTFESFVTLPDGSEFLHMRVEYTRAAS